MPADQLGKVEAREGAIAARTFGLGDGALGRAVDFLGTALRLPSRLLMSEDQVFRHSTAAPSCTRRRCAPPPAKAWKARRSTSGWPSCSPRAARAPAPRRRRPGAVRHLHTKIKDVRVLVLKAVAADQYAASDGQVSTASTTYQVKTTLTFTPGVDRRLPW